MPLPGLGVPFHEGALMSLMPGKAALVSTARWCAWQQIHRHNANIPALLLGGL